MKCPIDQTEMKKGTFGASMRFYKEGQGFFSFGSRWLTWYCPKCGKIELYTEPDKEGEQDSE